MNLNSWITQHSVNFKDILSADNLNMDSLNFLPNNEIISKFEKLLLLRILRPELLEIYMKDFIKISFGKEYLDFPGFDLKLAMKDATK